MIRAIAFAGLAASFAAGASEIQKCADTIGRITYQDAACARGSTIGTLPRESAQGDPAALKKLESDRARLIRAADAQIVRDSQPAPVILLQTPQQGVVGGNVVQPAGEPVYTGPVYGVVDPNTGALTIQGAGGVPIAIQPSTQQPSTQQPAAIPQPAAQASITQPPTETQSSITQVPSATSDNVLTSPAGTIQSTRITGSPGTAPSPTITASPGVTGAPVGSGGRR